MDKGTESGHIIAVTHPPLIRGAIVHALQAPPAAFFRIDVAPLSITDLRFNGKAWTLRSTGYGLMLSIEGND
jgi:broad specificity phosphatase PhoE